ncbi:hypothetical protein ASG40_09600 [Methylobacterium sp. Leaf399]|uniref:heparinase II/III domain-containing protein n=1 Tax=Methylobacterium sp. Leaf399 TaxID=1736364 RepID=UPI00070073B0|nr:heparinase II/III family protein [Methylobacterium sp. Leaf399]KQT09967.1 hypothetical protein ASG40_09600 [Methylobacterium sp. Leaf399]
MSGPTPSPDPSPARYAGGAHPGAGEDEHVVGTKNRWSRVVLAYGDLVPDGWCEVRFGIAWDADETAAAAPDFALVGIDPQAQDGSSLDLDQMPGLDRTQLDPHGTWIAGPAYHPGEAAAPRAALVRVAFMLPAPAARVAVTIRSWRNTRPFVVTRPQLSQARRDALAPPPSRRRRRLGPEPVWFDHVLVPGRPLVLRGQIFAATPGEHAAHARILYRDAGGTPIPPPYPGTIVLPALGAFVDLPTQQQARRFTLDLMPPPDAARVSVGFAAWDGDGRPVELIDDPEVALDDRLRLESVSGDDLLAAPAFLARLAEHLELSDAAVAAWCPPRRTVAAVPPILARARALQDGEAKAGAGVLRLAACPDWPVPETPDWTEDPFRSVPWRIAYQALTWLWPMAESPGGPERALALALSWSAGNPWGDPADGLALHPAALAQRAEVFVRLLGRAPEGEAAALVLTGEIARHGFALAEIVGQNALARSLLQFEAAAALLGVARALPALPVAAHWTGLALSGVAACIERQIRPDGSIPDPSLHRRLDLATLGRALAEGLTDHPLAATIAGRVEAAMPGLTGLLDPGGRLPPFGDTPHGVDHAAWIGRLRGRRALETDLVADRRRGPPPPPPEPAAPSGGVIVLRQDAPGRLWGHLACTYAANGSGHRDATSFVYATEGVRWIVEAGGSSLVETGAVRHHLVSAQGHNVAAPDGREPMAGEAWLAGVTALDGATAYEIGTGVHGSTYAHARLVVALHDLSGLVVLDRFATRGGPIAMEGWLHLGPDILAAIVSPRRAMAQHGRSRLAFTPIVQAGRAAGLAIVNGRNDRPGTMQGFVSQAAGALTPSSVLRYALSGTDRVCGGMMIASDTVAEGRLATLLAGRALAPILAGPES